MERLSEVQQDIEFWEAHKQTCENGPQIAEKNLARLALRESGQQQINLYPEIPKTHDRYSDLGDQRSVTHGDNW